MCPGTCLADFFYYALSYLFVFVYLSYRRAEAADRVVVKIKFVFTMCVVTLFWFVKLFLLLSISKNGYTACI